MPSLKWLYATSSLIMVSAHAHPYEYLHSWRVSQVGEYVQGGRGKREENRRTVGFSSAAASERLAAIENTVSTAREITQQRKNHNYLEGQRERLKRE